MPRGGAIISATGRNGEQRAVERAVRPLRRSVGPWQLTQPRYLVSIASAGSPRATVGSAARSALSGSDVATSTPSCAIRGARSTSVPACRSLPPVQPKLISRVAATRG